MPKRKKDAEEEDADQPKPGKGTEEVSAAAVIQSYLMGYKKSQSIHAGLWNVFTTFGSSMLVYNYMIKILGPDALGAIMNDPTLSVIGCSVCIAGCIGLMGYTVLQSHKNSAEESESKEQGKRTKKEKTSDLETITKLQWEILSTCLALSRLGKLEAAHYEQMQYYLDKISKDLSNEGSIESPSLRKEAIRLLAGTYNDLQKNLEKVEAEIAKQSLGQEVQPPGNK